MLGRAATRDEAPIILDEYGNTASAGSLIAFSLHSDDLAGRQLRRDVLVRRRLLARLARCCSAAECSAGYRADVVDGSSRRRSPRRGSQSSSATSRRTQLLDDPEQKRLRDLVQVFIAEKNWEGCGGLELDDEIRVTIAGTGCLLMLGREPRPVPGGRCRSSSTRRAVVHREQARSFFDPAIVPVEHDSPVLGLAVRGGAVVLAWDICAPRRARRQGRP